jgi:hypothetical protein
LESERVDLWGPSRIDPRGFDLRSDDDASSIEDIFDFRKR